MKPSEALESLRAWAVGACARLLAHFLFRRIDLEGRDRIPKEGSVLVIANHENNLVDPMLMLAFGAHPVRFLAKHTLFAHFLVRPLTWLVRAVAVYRKEDGGDARRNELVLERTARRLIGGDVIGVFPEGVCHNDSRRRRLKAGPARVALWAAQQGGSRAVWVLPVGIHYADKSRFRSDVALLAGEPLRVDPDEPPRRLTERMAAALEAVTLNAPSWTAAEAALRRAEMAAGARDTAPPPLERFKRLAAEVSAADPEAPLSDLPRWADLPVEAPVLGRTLGWTLAALLTLPVAIVPLALTLLPAHLGRRTPDEPATRRLVAALLFVPPLSLLHGILVAEPFGPLAGLAVCLMTPVALFVWARAMDVWSDTRKAARLRHRQVLEPRT